MKPFNLEEALAGKAVMLRSGEKAYVRYFESELMVTTDARVVGYSDGGLLLSWCPDGYYNPITREPYHRDIVEMYPETRLINGFEVPAPETKPLTDDTMYYVPAPADMEFYAQWHWSGCDFDLCILDRGMIFLNANDAIANAKAMLGIDPNTGDEE